MEPSKAVPLNAAKQDGPVPKPHSVSLNDTETRKLMEECKRLQGEMMKLSEENRHLRVSARSWERNLIAMKAAGRWTLLGHFVCQLLHLPFFSSFSFSPVCFCPGLGSPPASSYTLAVASCVPCSLPSSWPGCWGLAVALLASSLACAAFSFWALVLSPAAAVLSPDWHPVVQGAWNVLSWN